MSAANVRNFLLNNLRWVVIGSLALLLISGTVWYDKVYSNPKRVWQVMLENNLKSSSITRKIALKSEENEVEQIVQLFFGQKTYTNSSSRLSRLSAKGNSSARTETLGTTNTDFLRYTELQLGENNQPPPNTDSILNVWGRQNKDKKDPARSGKFLQEAILGIMPFGNLAPKKRAEFLRFMSDRQAYKVDFAGATKVSLNGRTAYEYKVNINPERYAEVLKKYIKIMNLGQVKGVNPEDFAGLPEVQTKIAVDILSRQLVSITYLANSRTEEYLSFGLQKPLKEPSSSIEFNELQKRLQDLR